MSEKFDYKNASVELTKTITVHDIYPKGIPDAPKGWEYYSFGNKGKKGDKYLYYDSGIYPLGYSLEEDITHDNNKDGQLLWLRPVEDKGKELEELYSALSPGRSFRVFNDYSVIIYNNGKDEQYCARNVKEALEKLKALKNG